MSREEKGNQFREVQRSARVPRIFSYGNAESVGVYLIVPFTGSE
jgi:hypothetical protein